METWWVYIVKKGDKLYVGITTHVTNRMRQHREKVPLYLEGPMLRSAAVIRERTIKKWSRKKKLILIQEVSSH